MIYDFEQEVYNEFCKLKRWRFFVEVRGQAFLFHFASFSHLKTLASGLRKASIIGIFHLESLEGNICIIPPT